MPSRASKPSNFTLLAVLSLSAGLLASPARAQEGLAPPPPPPAPAPAPNAQEVTTNPGEKNVSLEDRVKSVQRKDFLMKHRLSLSVDGAASLNDAFFQKWGGGAQLGFAISDPFALVAHFDYFYDQQLENTIIAKQALSSQLNPTRLQYLGALDFAWTPIYGKFATFNEIVHFDLYVLAGVGVAGGEQGLDPATEIGLGERTFFTDWFSAGVEGRYVFYADSAPDQPTTLQRQLLVSAVATFWFPLHSAQESH